MIQYTWWMFPGIALLTSGFGILQKILWTRVLLLLDILVGRMLLYLQLDRFSLLIFSFSERLFGWHKRFFRLRVTVCSCDVRYAFQSEYAIYSCLNVKELLAQSRCKIQSLSDCNWTQTYNQLQSLKLHISCLLRARSSFWNA